VAALCHGATFRGRILRTLLAGRTVWDGVAVGPPGLGRFVAPVRPEETRA
jgi:hypothetical protein